MTLKFYFHPLASYCHKVLIALYEHAIAFDPIIVDLGDERSSAELRVLWPVAKFPVLRDEARSCTVAESTIIIEYLDAYYPVGAPFVPPNGDLAWQTRMWDRFYDLYVHEPMQRIVGDRLRPTGHKDPFGVEQAVTQLARSYAMIEKRMQSSIWATGEAFTLADCAAAPALFYANTIVPLGIEHPNTRAYLERLMTRPSYARVLEEAQPYFGLFPMERKPQISRPVRAANQ
ncbi:MAG: glutathione S-transferase family protein [Pseudolabrys sp.]